MIPEKEYSKLTVPNKLAYGSVVGSYVNSVARNIGFNEEERQMIELGVDEAFTNVIEHAFEPGEDATFDVICTMVPLGLMISIQEKGLPFDPTKIPEYDPSRGLEDQSGAGMGFYLMRESMDEVNFNNLGKEGKETQMIKYLKKKSIEDYFDASELEQFDRPLQMRPKAKDTIQFEIRAMRSDEAVDVSRCVYKTYGYSYDKEHAYYPERIVELNENGLMTSSVALDGEEVAGHCALFRDHPGDKIAEIGMAVVKPKYRGQGCLKYLTEDLLKDSRENGMTGIFAQAVSNHPFSQKAMHKFNFRDCGMLLANVPTTRSFKGITETLSQRESYVISFQYLNKPGSLKVYAPPHHRDMIRDIYQNLGVEPHFCDPDLPGDRSLRGIREDEEGSTINTKVYAQKGIAYMEIPEFWPATLKDVRARLKDLCLKRIDVIYLYLNLQDPITNVITSDMEGLGFFFGGIFPGKPYGDALILQYLNNVPIDYSKIAVASDLSSKLSNYVEKHDPNII